VNGAALVANHAAPGERVASQRIASCIDLNDSTATRLTELPHVRPARAEDIIAGRPWQRPAELSRLSGISAGRVGEIRRSGLLCAESG